MTTTEKIKLRASVNKWISTNFPHYRKYLTHSCPRKRNKDTWLIDISIKQNSSIRLGSLKVSNDYTIVKPIESICGIEKKIDSIIKKNHQERLEFPESTTGIYHNFYYGDGIQASQFFNDKSIDLLLTDPPYGISKSYTCESQIPRRLRKDGSDFIMPKGSFGEWDYNITPSDWTDLVLPKIKGWAVIFCSHAQIGEYMTILENHKFNSVGTFVWKKTNPVPFNHKFKPINSWESIVLGKRPGTKFNGHVVHNFFECKSPSPQERIHPTQKPLLLMNKFIELFSDENGIVFDPFGGSATTVISCINMKRKVFSYENDLEIYKLAYKRIERTV